MFGLSGGDHSNCFSNCYNNYAPRPNSGGSNFGNSGETSGSGITSIIECEIPCSAAFSFYGTSSSPSASTNRKPVELTKYNTIVKDLKSGRKTTTATTTRSTTIGRSAKVWSRAVGSTSKTRRTYFTSLRPSVTLNGAQYQQVLRTSIQQAVPSALVSGDYFSAQVPGNQICASSMTQSVKVGVLQSTGVKCANILKWIGNDKTIAAENLENVYNLLVLHQKCSVLPNNMCVMPMVESIKLTQ